MKKIIQNKKLKIEELPNNRYLINGILIYASNIDHAKRKYESYIKNQGER